MSEYEYETIDEDGDTWPEGVRKVATHHPVLGGGDEDPLNVSAKDLADRTAWAKVALGFLQSTADTHDGRLDALEGTADAHDGRLDALEGTADTHDGRLDALEGTADTHDGRLDALEAQVAVGAYTPIASNLSNLATVTGLTGHWIRLGQRVLVLCRWSANPSGSAIAKRFELTLPVPRASDFDTTADVTGFTVTRSLEVNTPSGGGTCDAFFGSQRVRIYFDLHESQGVSGTTLFTYSL